jgi:hypothetical protein
MTYQEQQYHQTKIEDYYYYSITKQDNSTTNKDNNKEKVPKELKQWVKRKIFEYCRQLKVPRKGFPSSIVYSAKEMNKLKGYKPTDKTTSYHKNHGTCYSKYSQIYINVPKHKGDTNNLLNTIVHEVLHYRFLGLSHNTPSSRAKYNKIVNLVLKEGKTARELLYSKDKVIVKRKNKPSIYRNNGNLMYWYTYARTLNNKSKLITKAYYKVNMHAETRQDKTRAYGIIECPELKGYVQEHPDIRSQRYFPYPHTYMIPIKK